MRDLQAHVVTAEGKHRALALWDHSRDWVSLRKFVRSTKCNAFPERMLIVLTEKKTTKVLCLQPLRGLSSELDG